MSVSSFIWMKMPNEPMHTEWLASGQHHSGIIVSDQLETGVLLRRLLRLIDAKAAEDMLDWLEFLSNWQ